MSLARRERLGMWPPGVDAIAGPGRTRGAGYTQRAVSPPSTTISVPVTYFDSSDAR